MYPATFPKNPPFVRIVNPSPMELVPTNIFMPLMSKTDNSSIILNECLQQVKKWKNNNSVGNIIIEVNTLLKINYPFIYLNHFPNHSQPNQMVYQYPKQVNNFFNNNYQSQSVSNFQQPNKSNSNWSTTSNMAKQPPIPFKTTVDTKQILPKAQKFVSSQKQKLSTIKSKYQSSLLTLQQLDTTQKALQSQSHTLHKQNKNIGDFVNHSQSNDKDFLEILKPSDELSEQMLSLNCSIKAREDVIQLLESKFNEQQITLDQFLKHCRKMQESRFEEKYILRKLIKYSPKFT